MIDLAKQFALIQMGGITVLLAFDTKPAIKLSGRSGISTELKAGTGNRYGNIKQARQ